MAVYRTPVAVLIATRKTIIKLLFLFFSTLSLQLLFQTLHTSSMETLDLVSSLIADHHYPSGGSLMSCMQTNTGCPHLLSCVQTNTGCGLVGQSQGSLCVFRVFNARDESLQLSPSFVVQMLEYTTFVGYDVWDVLLAVRQGKVWLVFLCDPSDQ